MRKIENIKICIKNKCVIKFNNIAFFNVFSKIFFGTIIANLYVNMEFVLTYWPFQCFFFINRDGTLKEDEISSKYKPFLKFRKFGEY